MLVLERQAAAEDRAEFLALLKAHPEFLPIYREQMRVHALLQCASESAGHEEARDPRPRKEPALVARWRPGLPVRWSAAALLCAALAGLWLLRSSAEPAGLATVRSCRHGQWADGSEIKVGAALKAGVCQWQSGLVELVTKDETVLLVEAPATLEMVNTLYARLIAGNVVVRMPKGRSGFVVETPGMKVFDLGTEFGVSTLPGGEARVQVFDGKVRAEASWTAVRKEVAAGETVRATAEGGLIAETYSERRFIRRFPPVSNPPRASGVLYSRSEVETVRVAYAPPGVATDGNLNEWTNATPFRSACDPPFDGTYYLEGRMMYDAAHLYLAAHVGDSDPMCNAAPEGFEFAGGSVIVRVSMDQAQGWPLKGTMFLNGAYDYSRSRIGAATRSERITSLIMWYDAQASRARIKVERGIDQHAPVIDPPGWEGVFRRDADGRGYTLEYKVSWKLLNCADHPPQAGDSLAALWMVHWSDSEGRIARGQLVEVTNHRPHEGENLPPYLYFQNGPSWGQAVYGAERGAPSQAVKQR